MMNRKPRLAADSLGRSSRTTFRSAVAIALIGTSASVLSCVQPNPSDAGDDLTGLDASVLTVTVGPSGGSLSSADGRLTLSVPSGALLSSVNLSVVPVSSGVAGSVGVAYELGPTGTRFVVAPTLTLHYVASDLGTQPATNLRLATLEAGQWRFRAASTLDVAAQTISTSIMHLSTYGAVLSYCNAPNGVFPTACGNSCVDTLRDGNNCGGCGIQCSANLLCENGTCGCGEGSGLCATGPTGTSVCGWLDYNVDHCFDAGLDVIEADAPPVCTQTACPYSCGGLGSVCGCNGTCDGHAYVIDCNGTSCTCSRDGVTTGSITGGCTPGTVETMWAGCGFPAESTVCDGGTLPSDAAMDTPGTCDAPPCFAGCSGAGTGCGCTGGCGGHTYAMGCNGATCTCTRDGVESVVAAGACTSDNAETLWRTTCGFPIGSIGCD